MSTISESIKLILVKRNKTLKELSAEIGMSSNSIYAKMNKNNGKNFKIGELEAIASALNCSFDTKFTLNDTHENF